LPKELFVAAALLVTVLAGSVPATAAAQSTRFPDVPPHHYAFAAVEWAVEVGVTVGYTDGTFKPRPRARRRTGAGCRSGEQQADLARGRHQRAGGVPQ
jgi:hypothetical protein